MLYERLHSSPVDEALEVARQLGACAQGGVCVVSACLLGVACRYDGLHKSGVALDRLLRQQQLLPLCPEVLARLGVPRPPMVFEGGDGVAALAGKARLVDDRGRDCTAQLTGGVTLALRLARAAGCQSAVLKARSPSCGVHSVHTATGLVAGQGMFAAACLEAGISVQSDEDFDELT